MSDSEEITVTSTSLQSAVVEQPIVLREGSATRLIFRPEIVRNKVDQSASVRGHLLWQKKGKKDCWEDSKDIALSSLRKGEGVVFELRAAEVRVLFEGVKQLYELHEAHGVPMGKHTFVATDSPLAALLSLGRDELTSLVDANHVLGASLLVRLLRWASEQRDVDQIVDDLTGLDPEHLLSLSAVAGVASLRQAERLWAWFQEHRDDPRVAKEEVWQKAFVKRQFLLEHLFAQPIAVVKEKAYVGGKSIQNTGGNLVDFLLKNDLTHNAVLLEIKTPLTRLLGSEYRAGLHNASSDLTGSVLQVLDYRSCFATNWQALAASGEPPPPTPIDPPSVVIIGSSTELDTPDKRKSFELFRNQFSAVTMVTFDEVFERCRRLIRLLAGTA